MNDYPAYSVVIPAYNATPFIGETIASVMEQTNPPERIIVVDDGSTDDLSTAIAGLTVPLTLIRQENSGPGSATSRGLALVETEYLATVDADDLWLHDKIEQQFAALLDPNTDMVFTRMDSFGDSVGAAHVNDARSGWSRSTLLMRREAFRRVGPIEDMPGYCGEMVEWIARARELGIGITMLETVLARRRVHKGSLSWERSPAQDKGYMEVVLRALRRRKEADK